MTFHEGTPYARYSGEKAFSQVDDERVLEMTLLIEQTMKRLCFEHYEISNFAMPGKRSRHNQRYWTEVLFWGLAQAHSFVRDGWNIGHRWENRKVPERYFQTMEQEDGAPLRSQTMGPPNSVMRL